MKRVGIVSSATSFASLLHHVLLVLLFTDGNMSVSSSFIKLASTPLTLNSVVYWLAHPVRWIKIGSAASRAWAIGRAHGSSELHALYFPLRHAVGRRLLCLWRLNSRLFLLTVPELVFFDAFAVRIGRLALLCYVELLSFFAEYLLANLYVLLQRLRIE